MEKNEVLYPEKKIGSLPGWLGELMSVLLFLCWFSLANIYSYGHFLFYKFKTPFSKMSVIYGRH